MFGFSLVVFAIGGTGVNFMFGFSLVVFAIGGTGFDSLVLVVLANGGTGFDFFSLVHTPALEEGIILV